MYQYGQELTWSTPSAPRAFTGVCRRFTARDAFTNQMITDEVGGNLAAVLHSAKVALDWEMMVTSDSTDFLDLSTGAKIAVSGLTGGTILCSRAEERWSLGQAKTASISATKYSFTGGANDAPVAISAFTPSQSGLSIVTPGNPIIYGTHGLSHAAGVLHELTLTQEWRLVEHPVSPLGVIPGCVATGFMRRISALILATSTQPAKGATLAITGAPNHAANAKIESSEEAFEDQRGKFYRVAAFWIPPFNS